MVDRAPALDDVLYTGQWYMAGLLISVSSSPAYTSTYFGAAGPSLTLLLAVWVCFFPSCPAF